MSDRDAKMSGASRQNLLPFALSEASIIEMKTCAPGMMGLTRRELTLTVW